MSGPGFHQHLSQRQTQQMVLAPQLRQSLKILQVAALDLRSVIQEELQKQSHARGNAHGRREPGAKQPRTVQGRR